MQVFIYRNNYSHVTAFKHKELFRGLRKFLKSWPYVFKKCPNF